MGPPWGLGDFHGGLFAGQTGSHLAVTAGHQVHFENEDMERFRPDVGVAGFVGSLVPLEARGLAYTKVPGLMGAFDEKVRILGHPVLDVDAGNEVGSVAPGFPSASHVFHLWLRFDFVFPMSNQRAKHFQPRKAWREGSRWRDWAGFFWSYLRWLA